MYNSYYPTTPCDSGHVFHKHKSKKVVCVPLSLQANASNTWRVPSISGIHGSGYIVNKVKDTCVECTDSKVCKSAECSFRCQCMYTCSCYDYNNGHLCKHVHRVHSLNLINHAVQSESIENEESTVDHPTTEPSEPMVGDIDEDHIPGVTITSEGEHFSDTTGTDY